MQTKRFRTEEGPELKRVKIDEMEELYELFKMIIIEISNLRSGLNENRNSRRHVENRRKLIMG
jgi:hypothetical protein